MTSECVSALNRKEFSERLKRIKCVLLDLDGTVYLGDEVLVGAKEAIERFRECGKKVIFLTNNSSKTDEEYAEKLGKMGLLSPLDSIWTSGDATAKFLIQNGLDKNVFLLATDKVKRSFENYGISLVEKNPEVAVLCYDTSLNYSKMCAFSEALVTARTYVATHPDNVCPAKGVYLPDVGSFIEMFKTSSSRQPSTIIGKPNTFMGELIVKEFDCAPEEVMMVGDRLYTDIRFGVNCKFLTALVLSGETTREMADLAPQDSRADGIFQDIKEIADIL